MRMLPPAVFALADRTWFLVSWGRALYTVLIGGNAPVCVRYRSSRSRDYEIARRQLGSLLLPTCAAVLCHGFRGIDTRARLMAGDGKVDLEGQGVCNEGKDR
jgi:hypothetical protein